MIISILNFFISCEHVIDETFVPMSVTYRNSQVTLEIIDSALVSTPLIRTIKETVHAKYPPI